ncbi:DUF1189 domain-containing protein [Enterococcus timonensis]|uniref:DUF1189 domain-containing protein n=1 Tax=Enterococcus timonensis TaxID=1852364 RepID=UPI0008DA096D|nr:DUF1189 domain-containing protein [Enterococcus timonensis]
MTFWQGLRYALTDFRKLMNVVFMPFWKVMVYSLFLAGILTVPIVWQMGLASDTFKSDAQTITHQLPDFEIKNHQLTAANNQSGIFMTDHLIVTFDPGDQRTAKEVYADASISTISVGLFSDQVVVGLPSSEVLNSVLGGNHFTFNYDEANLEGFSKAELSDTLQMRLPWWLYVLLFLVALYPVLLNLLINIIFLTIAGLLYGLMKGVRIRFMAAMKMVVFASTWSVVVMAVLSFIGLPYNEMFVMMVLTLIVFSQILRGFPQLPKPGTDQKS